MNHIAIHEGMNPLYLTTEGEVITALPNNGAKSFTLEELQAYVGGLAEFVRVQTKGVILIVNEEGMIHDLPINPIATIIAQQPICGNALICPLRFVDEEDDE